MQYLGTVYQQQGKGASFQGKIGAGEGYLMVLCGIYRNGCMDMELSAYVMRRFRKWAMDMSATEDGIVELHRELAQMEHELKTHERLQRERGATCKISWEYLSLLLCKESLGILTVKGTGEAWVCNRSMGRNVKEKLLPDGIRDSTLIAFQGRVGILLSAGLLPEEVHWQETLAPGEIHTREQLQRRVRELAVYGGEKSGSIGYLISRGGCDCKAVRKKSDKYYVDATITG